MDLHQHPPEAAVVALLELHNSTLALYHGFLESAVPKVCALWEPLYPDISELPGDVFCGSVRAAVWRIAERSTSGPRSLAVVKLPPNSKQLVDSSGMPIRMRRYPWDPKRQQRVPVDHTTVDAESLFGDFPSLVYDFAILWEPDLQTGTLRSAFLAALYGLDTNRIAIYAREPLPEPVFEINSGGFGGSFSDNGPPDDDDFGPDEDTGDNPA